MKQWAGTAAVMLFFIMAFVGWACDAEPLACGLRAAGGAIAFYILINMAGKFVLSIVADAVVKETQDKSGKEQSQ